MAILVRILAFGWLIIAYFMVRDMEPKSQADSNKKELTMDLILFLAKIAAFFVCLLIVNVLINLVCMKCNLAWGQDRDLVIIIASAIQCSAIFVYSLFNYDIVCHIFTLNDDLSETDARKARESLFLEIIFVLVAISVILSYIFLLLLALVTCFVSIFAYAMIQASRSFPEQEELYIMDLEAVQRREVHDFEAPV